MLVGMTKETEGLFDSRYPWEEGMRKEWADASPGELLDEIMRLRRGMDGVRSRHLLNHHQAAEALHCWTWNGCDPDEWKPSNYHFDDERAYQEHLALNLRLRREAGVE